MNEQEWLAELKTYRSSKRTIKETLEGVADHLDTPCSNGQTRTVVNEGSSSRGLPPFREEHFVCDRGTKGCSKVHNDGQALVFARMGLERAVELAKVGK